MLTNASQRPGKLGEYEFLTKHCHDLFPGCVGHFVKSPRIDIRSHHLRGFDVPPRTITLTAVMQRKCARTHRQPFIEWPIRNYELVEIPRVESGAELLHAQIRLARLVESDAQQRRRADCAH